MFAGAPHDFARARRVLVIGGANIDVKCHIDGAVVSGTSNPGHVATSVGGVGRNVAHNLALLGCKTRLMTAIGADVHGQMLRESCAHAGIDFAALTIDQPTGTYTAVLDSGGDLVIGISAMAVMDALLPQALLPLMDSDPRPDFLVADANLPESTIFFLTKKAKKDHFLFIFEPVSVPKCVKIREVLAHGLPVFLMSPNRAQLAALTGIDTENDGDLSRACARLHAQNVQNLIIGLGAAGAFWSDGFSSGRVAALQTRIADATGGGDAALAAALWALTQGLPLGRAAEIGQRAAALTVACADTVNTQMSPELILKASQ